MATSLKVSRIDSPLGRRLPSETNPAGPEADGTVNAVMTSPITAAAANRAAGEAPQPGLRPPTPATVANASGPAVSAESPPEPEARTKPQGYRLPDAVWEPPALDERSDLFAARLPVPLAQAMERHVRALRDRNGGASQKQLPMHEVLAAIIWAIGDPDDPDTTERIAHIHRQYRGRRMAAAAARTLEIGD
jgi:hypothetical protein